MTYFQYICTYALHTTLDHNAQGGLSKQVPLYAHMYVSTYVHAYYIYGCVNIQYGVIICVTYFSTEEQSNEISAPLWTANENPHGSCHCCSRGFPFHDVSEYM